MTLLGPLLLAAPAVAPPPFSGVVVDPSGRPVAGARVCLAGTPGYPGIALKGEARTDAGGRIFMPRPAGTEKDGSPASSTLWAHAAGRRLGVRPFVGGPPGPEAAVRFEVGPPARTFVRLVPPDPGRPREFTDRIRNRGGLPLAVPTSFLAPDCPPLRPGIVTEPAYVRGRTVWASTYPGQLEDIPAKPAARFDPGPATRTIGPAEAIDAFVLLLVDWFDAVQLGIYSLRVRFTAESGFGEVKNNFLILPLPAPAQVPPLPESVSLS